MTDTTTRPALYTHTLHNGATVRVYDHGSALYGEMVCVNGTVRDLGRRVCENASERGAFWLECVARATKGDN